MADTRTVERRRTMRTVGTTRIAVRILRVSLSTEMIKYLATKNV